MSVIEYLKSELEKEDPVSSSHWNFYHKDFKLQDGNLTGLKGFGGNSKKYNFISKKFHIFFQKKWKNHSQKSLFFNQVLKSAEEISLKHNGSVDLDIIRQCLTIDLLNKKGVFKNINTAVVIGDGFGIMSSLLLKNKLVKKVISCNLNKTLLVDMVYIKKAFGEKYFDENSGIIKNKSGIETINEKKIVALQAQNYELLKFIKKDLVINIASFQEMNLEVINNYMEYLYSDKKPFYFYLCNRIEKFLPDGSLIKFKDFQLNKNDDIIIDELCKWHHNYYSFKPPFIHNFDGPHIHQLRYCN
jgi:putative sugar O-methyltransferase